MFDLSLFKELSVPPGATGQAPSAKEVDGSLPQHGDGETEVREEPEEKDDAGDDVEG